MIDQDLGFHWATTTPTSRSSLINDHHSSADSSHELHLAKIKKELSSQYSPSIISEITTINNFSNLDDEYHLASSARNYFKHENELQDLHDLSSSATDENKLFLRNLISSGDHLYYNPQSSTAGFSHHPSKYFSQIFPSMNISSLNPSSLSSSFSSSTTHQPYSDMNNYEALDLLSSSPSTKIDGSSCFGQTSSSISQSSNNLIGGRQLMKEGLSFHHHLDHDYDQQIRSSSLSWPFANNPSKISSSMNLGGREVTTSATKRSSSCSGSSGSTTKASQTAAPKKPRLESRSSFPPIKVRKEKLADRIATLQQLVAPFGKTDTASVIMEATGYIKFLQEQVETLSVPYMKPSIRNNMRSKIQRGSTAGEGETDEPKRDLRSRGLCLVPLSCTSYITNDINLGVNWSSPHYGGARL